MYPDAGDRLAHETHPAIDFPISDHRDIPGMMPSDHQGFIQVGIRQQKQGGDGGGKLYFPASKAGERDLQGVVDLEGRDVLDHQFV